jgi:hypothetical protein
MTKILMEQESPEGWTTVENPTHEFLELNACAKKLCDMLRVQFPQGCEASIKTFDMASDAKEYWIFHVKPDEENPPLTNGN